MRPPLLLSLTLALAGVSACAFTQEERDRWRVELEPRILPEAMGEGAEWLVKNANHGELNVWRWRAPPGQDLVYVYQRHATCDRRWRPSVVLFVTARREAWWGPDARGVSLAPAPGELTVMYEDARPLPLEKHTGEALLILIEPWNHARVHYYASREETRAAEEERGYRQRSAEMLAERCRKRQVIGRPREQVPRKLLLPRLDLESRPQGR